MRIPMKDTPARIMYTMFPPASCFWRDIEKRDEAAEGAIDRIQHPTACAIPFVAPKDALLGAESTIKTIIVARAVLALAHM
jgi:hypothetical protein